MHDTPSVALSAPARAGDSNSPPFSESVSVFTVRGSSHHGHTVKIKAARILVGSSPNATLRLVARGVDPAHCLIIRGRRQTIFRALSPAVRYNGLPSGMGVLNPGDTLAIGPVELVYGEPTAASNALRDFPSSSVSDLGRPIFVGDAPLPHLSVVVSSCPPTSGCTTQTVPEPTGCIVYQSYLLEAAEDGQVCQPWGVSRDLPAYLAPDGEARAAHRELSQIVVWAERLAEIATTWERIRTAISEPIDRLAEVENRLEKGLSSLSTVATRLESVGSNLEKWSRRMNALNPEGPKTGKSGENPVPAQPGAALPAGDSSVGLATAATRLKSTSEGSTCPGTVGTTNRPTLGVQSPVIAGSANARPPGDGSAPDPNGSTATCSSQELHQSGSTPPGACAAGSEDLGRETRSATNPEESLPCDHDQAVKNYMNELLARLRSASQASKANPPEATLNDPAQEKERSEGATKPKKKGPVTPSAARPSARKKVVAPEKQVDFAAMRELANLSSQAAIDRYAKAKLAQAQKGKLTALLTALVCGAALLALDYCVAHGPAVKIAFFVDLVVILVYGLQYALLTGRLIVNPKGQLQLAQRRIGREMRKLVPTAKPLVDPQLEADRPSSVNETCGPGKRHTPG